MSPGKDLEAQTHKLTGEIGALEAAADQLRGAANDLDRKASRKRARLGRIIRQRAELAVGEARNEAKARAAVAVAAQEDQ